MLIAALVVGGGPLTHAQEEGGPGTASPQSGVVPQAAVAAARDAVYPALVNLSVVRRTFSGGRTVRVPVNGSGVVVRPDGLVLTNYHVAQDAARITATLTSGEVLDAEVEAHDPLTDLSVLRLLRPDGDGRPFPYAELGDSDALQVGEPVLAMGNPLALSSSVSLGIVANPRRVFTDFSGSSLEDMELGGGERTGVFTRWIQHDALILPGNSGGPLVDLEGRVVGINELGQAGLGFAIPARVAGRVLEQVVEHGRVPRGWFGFRVLPVAKLGRESGALVSAVLPGSPAEAAGLQPGDLLLRLAGEPVALRFFEEVPPFYARVAELPLGERVELVVERGGLMRTLAGAVDPDEGGEPGEPLTLRVTVEEMEPSIGPQGEVAGLGATLQEITRPMALDRSLPDASGLLVTGVRTGSPLAEAEPAVSAGDVLLRIGGTAVSSLEAADRLVAERLDGEDASTAVTFRRQRQELVTVIEPTPPRRDHQGGELPTAWLGARTQVLTGELARALGIDGGGGFRVTEVYPGTAAAAAGLEVGDVIRGLGGEALRADRPRNREDLRRAVEARSPGEEVTLSVLRPGEGAPRELNLRLEPRPAEPSPRDRVRQETLEVAVRDVAFEDRRSEDWERDQPGALVVEIEQGSWAQMAGLRLGDLVLRVAGREIADAEAFNRVVRALLDERPRVIPLYVRRGQRTHFIFIEPDWGSPAG